MAGQAGGHPSRVPSDDFALKKNTDVNPEGLQYAASAKYGGGYRNFRECSLSLETFADIAEWFLAEIQRKSPAENDFEAEQKDGIPLNCNLSASKQPRRTFEPCTEPAAEKFNKRPSSFRHHFFDLDFIASWIISRISDSASA